MRKKIVIILVFCGLFSIVHSQEDSRDHSSSSVYRQIKNICQPTYEDYCLIQNYLSHGKREGLEKLLDTELRLKGFKIVDLNSDKRPQSGIIHVNTGSNDRENCLVLYGSFNMNFVRGLWRLIKIVKESDFKGHIIYHLGGWPDLEGGSLTLAHVPFAFKPCCFKEAQRLGYKRALWLDCSIIPLVSLNTIFEIIEEKKCFSIDNFHRVGAYCNAEAAAFFGFTLDQTYHLKSCQAGLLGIDLTSEIGKKIIDMWYAAAQHKNAFYSARSDQTALSLVLHKYNLKNFPEKTAKNISNKQEPGQFFAVDRKFVH